MRDKITILVVDDEPMMRDLLAKVLIRDGYRVLISEDGVAAFEVIEKEDVDIVLSDLEMPLMSGFDLLKKVKDEYPQIGMIMMTGYGDTYTVKDALLLGADEYITKPFKNHEISLVVERVYWRLLSEKHETGAEVK
ncbi:MAG: response regulator [candidate division Zixibacteria bacterium]|nr:response regulator [candidate division Zixibacteria bacterium]